VCVRDKGLQQLICDLWNLYQLNHAFVWHTYQYREEDGETRCVRRQAFLDKVVARAVELHEGESTHKNRRQWKEVRAHIHKYAGSEKMVSAHTQITQAMKTKPHVIEKKQP
jgi:hypothetical protein